MATTQIFSAQSSRVLAADEVHVQRIALEAGTLQAQRLAYLLTPAEQARASRFRIEEDRCRFQVARAATRLILGGYLGLAPETVAIDVNQFGKPQLDASLVTQE